MTREFTFLDCSFLVLSFLHHFYQGFLLGSFEFFHFRLFDVYLGDFKGLLMLRVFYWLISDGYFIGGGWRQISSYSSCGSIIVLVSDLLSLILTRLITNLFLYSLAFLFFPGLFCDGL